MPDDWRDKLAAFKIDDPNTHDDDCACGGCLPGWEVGGGIPTPAQIAAWQNAPCDTASATLSMGLERDEMIAIQTKALDTVLESTGRTIRHPHETHADRQARLRGIPAIGSVGGAIKGTRPDHA